MWKALDETKYSDLRDQVQALNARSSETFKNANTPSDCYDLISKDTFFCVYSTTTAGLSRSAGQE